MDILVFLIAAAAPPGAAIIMYFAAYAFESAAQWLIVAGGFVLYVGLGLIFRWFVFKPLWKRLCSSIAPEDEELGLANKKVRTCTRAMLKEYAATILSTMAYLIVCTVAWYGILELAKYCTK